MGNHTAIDLLSDSTGNTDQGRLIRLAKDVRRTREKRGFESLLLLLSVIVYFNNDKFHVPV